MHARKLAMASNVKSDGNPRCEAGEQSLARWMQGPKALNEQSLLACRTAETKCKSNCNSVAQDKNGQRQDNRPGPAEDENHDCAKKTTANQQLDHTISHDSAYRLRFTGRSIANMRGLTRIRPHFAVYFETSP